MREEQWHSKDREKYIKGHRFPGAAWHGWNAEVWRSLRMGAV